MSKMINLLDSKINNLTVIGLDNIHTELDSRGNRLVKWFCKCVCGQVISIKAKTLHKEKVLSCGCITNKKSRKTIDIAGSVYGRLKVIEKSHKNNYGYWLWKCICECGNFTLVTSNRLRTNITRSCGCLYAETRGKCAYKHGNLSNSKKTPEYISWHGMKTRCYNENNTSYYLYGGRGIKVCDRWLDQDFGFINFLKDMGKCPDGFTLDKIDNNKDYSLQNCRWASALTQARNQRKRKNVSSKYFGVYYSKTRQNWKAQTPTIFNTNIIYSLGTYLTETSAALAVKNWLISNPEYQEFWKLGEYPNG